MNTLLESIDLLLMESPENLGFPEYVVDEIEKTVPKHRKNQHYLAMYFKSWEGKWSRMQLVKLLNRHLEDDQKARLLQKFGVRGIEVKPEDEYSVRERNKFASEIKGLMTTIKTIDDLLTLRKKTAKAIGKSKLLDVVTREIDVQMSRLVSYFEEKHKNLVRVLRHDKNAYREFKGLDLEQAEKKASELDIAPPIDTSRVILELSGGYFWYEVSTEECSLEGERMNHCGQLTSEGNVMYSLRDKNNKPHVTAEWKPRHNEMIQIRGGNNEMPKSKYWDHIAKLVGHFDAFVPEGAVELNFNDARKFEFYEAITKYGGACSFLSEQYARAFQYTLSNLPQEMDRELSRAFGGNVSIRNGDGGLRDYGRGEYEVFMGMDLTINGEALSNYDKYLEVIEDDYALDELSDAIYDSAWSIFEHAFEPGVIYEVDMHPPGISRSGEILIEGIDFEPDIEVLTEDSLKAYKRGIMDALGASRIAELISEIEEVVEEIEIEEGDW